MNMEQVPDDILTELLSYLDIHDAAQATFVSRRWRNQARKAVARLTTLQVTCNADVPFAVHRLRGVRHLSWVPKCVLSLRIFDGPWQLMSLTLECWSLTLTKVNDILIELPSLLNLRLEQATHMLLNKHTYTHLTQLESVWRPVPCRLQQLTLADSIVSPVMVAFFLRCWPTLTRLHVLAPHTAQCIHCRRPVGCMMYLHTCNQCHRSVCSSCQSWHWCDMFARAQVPYMPAQLPFTLPLLVAALQASCVTDLAWHHYLMFNRMGAVVVARSLTSLSLHSQLVHVDWSAVATVSPALTSLDLSHCILDDADIVLTSVTNVILHGTMWPRHLAHRFLVRNTIKTADLAMYYCCPDHGMPTPVSLLATVAPDAIQSCVRVRLDVSFEALRRHDDFDLSTHALREHYCRHAAILPRATLSVPLASFPVDTIGPLIFQLRRWLDADTSLAWLPFWREVCCGQVSAADIIAQCSKAAAVRHVSHRFSSLAALLRIALAVTPLPCIQDALSTKVEETYRLSAVQWGVLTCLTMTSFEFIMAKLP